jgi:hypothetical protein
MRAREFVSEAPPLVTALASSLGQTNPGTVSSSANTIKPTGTSTAPAPAATTTATVGTATQSLNPQQIQNTLSSNMPAGKKFNYPGITGQVEVLPQQPGQSELKLRIPNIGDVDVDAATLSKIASTLPK